MVLPEIYLDPWEAYDALSPLALFVVDFCPRNSGTIAEISTSIASRTTWTPSAAFSATTRTPRCPPSRDSRIAGDAAMVETTSAVRNP